MILNMGTTHITHNGKFSEDMNHTFIKLKLCTRGFLARSHVLWPHVNNGNANSH